MLPAIFPELSSRTPAQTPETATAFSSFLKESVQVCHFVLAIVPIGFV